MHVGPKSFHALNNRFNILVEAKIACRQRHETGIEPVDHADCRCGQESDNHLAQNEGEMAGKWSDQQHTVV